jgi:hypothetical protein
VRLIELLSLPDEPARDPTDEEIDAYITGEIAEWAEETNDGRRMTAANWIDKETRWICFGLSGSS